MLTDENKFVLKKLSAMINSPPSDISQLRMHVPSASPFSPTFKTADERKEAIQNSVQNTNKTKITQNKEMDKSLKGSRFEPFKANQK